MSGHDYLSNRATADRLLAQFGGPFTLIKAVNLQYDPASGSMAKVDADADDTLVQEGIGVVLDYKANERANTSILAGDRKLLMSVSSMEAVTPVVGDAVEIGADTLRIIAITTLDPAGGATVLYTAQVRK